MRATTGLDKVKIYSREFRLKAQHSFTVETRLQQGQEAPALALDSTGAPVYATKVYCNSGELANYTITKRGLSIEFSPSRVYHSYQLAGVEQLADSLARVEREARQLGLLYSLDNSLVGRLDLARQADMSESFGAYSQVFSTLKAKRGRHRDLGTTYTVGNNLHQLCFYSKSAQLAELYRVNIPELNLLRAEARFMRAKAVKRHIGESRLESLLSADSKQLEAAYTTYLNNYLDNREGSQLAISFEQEAEHMQAIKAAVGRSWFLHWLVAQEGVGSVLDKFRTWENIAELLRAVGENRMQVLRYREKFEQVASLPTQEASSDTYHLLLTELREKLAA